MKNILFVLDSLICGGAEKSLISLLNNLDYERYSVELLLFKRGGEFEEFLPTQVNLIETPCYFRYVQGKLKGVILKKSIYRLYRVKTSIKLRMNDKGRCKNKNSIHSEQVVYTSIKTILEPQKKHYDVAIAYSQGFPTYYVAEKVKAGKKLAWINCDYVRTLYDKDLDNEFYNKIDKIIVVSDYIYNSMSTMKYNYRNKMRKILDIVDPKLIQRMARSEDAIEFKKFECFKILTVGRLVPIKGHDLIIKAAYLLKQNNYKFKWFIIGEGFYREKLELLIKEYCLENEVILLGAKSNPYPYMKECDLYVQASRREGFGLTVVEAKILDNVVLTTNFNTAKELINNEQNGIIVEINSKSIYEGISKLMDDKVCYNSLKKIIKEEQAYSSIAEIEKLYEEIS